MKELQNVAYGWYGICGLAAKNSLKARCSLLDHFVVNKP
jgi:hypothetical protein